MSLIDRLKSTKTLDMTTGNPYRLLIAFATPLLLGNLLQQLYNIVDSIIVGQIMGKDALASVGTTYPVVFLFLSLFNGIGIGVTVIISQFYGAKNYRSVQAAVDTAYKTFVVVALVLTTIGVLMTDLIVVWLDVPELAREMSATYLRVIFIGFIPAFGFNINAGILQGIGDTVSSLLYLAIATVINILLDLLFVGTFAMGVAGAAIATVVAQGISFAFGIWHINRRKMIIRISFFNRNFDPECLRESVRIGLPSGVQNMLFSLGAMAVQRLINSYGTDFMAGYTAAQKIDSLAFLPMISYANAITSYVGQNVGAGNVSRVWRGIRSAMVLTVATFMILAPIVLLFGKNLLNIFQNEPSAGMIDAGMAYLVRVVPFMFVLGLMFVSGGSLRGAGQAFVPFFVTLISLWLARVPFSYLLAHYKGEENLFFSFPIGWAFGLAIYLYYYFSGKWKRTIQRAVDMRQNLTVRSSDHD